MPSNFTSKRNPAYVGIVDGEGQLLGTSTNPLVIADANVQPQGTATPEKVLAGETFQSFASNDVQTGSIPNYTGTSPIQVQWTGGIPGQIRVKLPTGYFEANNPAEQVFILDADFDASNIADGKQIFSLPGSYTSDADATAADIKAGKTAYVKGVKITGTANF